MPRGTGILPVSLRPRFPASPEAGYGAGVELAVDFGVEAEDFAEAGEGDELDFFRVAGLEADGGAGGDVEAEAAGRGAVEAEGLVGLEEMIVRADLDRTVAGVGDGEGERREVDVRRERLAFRGDDFAGDHAERMKVEL